MRDLQERINSTRAVVVAVACLTAISGHAAQESDGTSLLAQSEKTVPSVESARETVRSAAMWLASGIDSWFGSKPFSDGGNVSDGQVSLNFYTRQDQKADISVPFNARFRLPNVEAKTYLFTGRDNWQAQLTDKPAAFANKQQLLQSDSAGSQAFFAGLGRSVSDSIDARVGFRDGLKLFAQGRYRRLWIPSENDELEFSQTIFVTRLDRLGSSTTFSMQHHFLPTLVVRWLNTVTVTQADPDVEWNGSLGVYRSMGRDRLLSLELLASSKQNTGMPLTDYGVQARWEQPVDHDKLIGEFIVGHFWPQSTVATDRATAWAFGAGLKMRF
jgi:hypothetical protein